MTTADDLRDLRDALDSIAHGALPRWGKPTTKTGEETQVAARQVYEKFVRALHHESAAQFGVAKARVEVDDHRTLNEALTNRAEQLEAEVARLRERIATQDDGLRYGEQVCARLVKERDEARAEVERLRAALEGAA